MLRGVLIAADFGGALILVATMNIITQETEYDRIATVRRWAWGRRSIYAFMALSLFVLGIYRFETDAPPPIDAIAHLILVFGVTFFPLMRAFGLTTQDVWVPDRIDDLLGRISRWNGNGDNRSRN